MKGHDLFLQVQEIAEKAVVCPPVPLLMWKSLQLHSPPVMLVKACCAVEKWITKKRGYLIGVVQDQLRSSRKNPDHSQIQLWNWSRVSGTRQPLQYLLFRWVTIQHIWLGCCHRTISQRKCVDLCSPRPAALTLSRASSCWSHTLSLTLQSQWIRFFKCIASHYWLMLVTFSWTRAVRHIAKM